ncbi:DUF2271 domain-containing protein [Arsukibacterium perlucidum]|uniref:DUF2271 domain-containing protein n=1 Tax=Arsukibacterium perlucidum TaxID=368811 RepID=UPI00037DEF0C|nr:DUF2271 domain-containing protein [Arsukibacterium perlucidum]
MKKQLFHVAFAMLMTWSLCVQAKEVTFTTQLTNYQGDGAYLAIYLTDSVGSYQRTIWVAGSKSKHYKHLTDWARGSKMSRSEYDGFTGASIANGMLLKVTINVDDALIDSGYQVRVDTAVEDMSENPADIIIPLTTAGVGIVVKGKGYVKTFSYEF